MALLNYFELNRFSIVALPFQVQSGIRPTIEYYDLCKNSCTALVDLGRSSQTVDTIQAYNL